MYTMRVNFQNSRHGTMLYRFLRYLSFNTPTLNVGFYNLKITFQCICMFSVSETVRGTHIYIFFPPRSCNCRFKIYARSLKYGYLTIGGTVCSCIRFCTQTDKFPPPPSQVWAGYERKGKPSIGTESSCVRVLSNACTAPCNLRAGH